MRWYGRDIVAVDGIIRAGERRAPPGNILPAAGWCYTQNHDRVILRLDGDYVCTAAVSRIKQNAEEAQKLWDLVEIAVVCLGAGRCHGSLQDCPRCGYIFDTCDVGPACVHHGDVARERRIAKTLAWLDSLKDLDQLCANSETSTTDTTSSGTEPTPSA